MEQNTNLAQLVGTLLKQSNLTICAAESCTGGLLMSTLTDVSGSSAYVLGGVVTYSNQAKQQLVKVREETLIAHGAVSEQTAREMVIGVCELFGADIGLSITGIAGPSGGTTEKPVGLVYVGAKLHDTITVERYIWNGNRAQNKLYSVEAALDIVKTMIQDEG